MGDCSDAEVDYMSDELLAQAELIARPGLPLKKNLLRDIQKEKRKAEQDAANKAKKRHVIESIHREQGLSKPIDASNKGFALLSAMGFKPGMRLGASKSISSDGAVEIPVGEANSATTARNDENLRLASGGLLEPISIVMKTDGRGGLGLAAEKRNESLARLECHLENTKREILQHNKKTEDFRKSLREQMELKAVAADLAASQRVCRQLELAQGVSEPLNKLFWPPEDLEIGSENTELVPSIEDEDSDILNNAEIFCELTTHLRERHLYCIWCGCRYQDADDLQANCPGNTRDAHDD